jgi:hypothetical protein
VDNTTPLSERLGASPGKLALIGVLAVALVGVLYLQYGGHGASGLAALDGEETFGSPRRPGRATASPSELPVDAWMLHAAPLDEQLWEVADLREIVKYDPFALPAAFPQPVQVTIDPVDTAGKPLADGVSNGDPWSSIVEDLQMQLQELRQRGVRVIVNRGDQYVAMIGDRTVHVGDEINGFTVTAIDPDGVLVERKIHQ